MEKSTEFQRVEKTDGGKEIYFWFLKRVIDSKSVTINPDIYGWRFSYSSAFEAEVRPMDVEPTTGSPENSPKSSPVPVFVDPTTSCYSDAQCILKMKSLGMYFKFYLIRGKAYASTNHIFYFRIRSQYP